VFGRKSIRTEILREHCAITEVDHPSGQSMGWKARAWDSDNGASRKTRTAHIYRSLHAGPHMMSIHMSSQVISLSHLMATGLRDDHNISTCRPVDSVELWLCFSTSLIASIMSFDGRGVGLQDPSSQM
jgi:hypothetical protein